jgi:hypothetical protein
VKTLGVSIAGLLSAAVAAGLPALIGLAALALTVIGVLCWILANRDRTENAVALITATRPLEPGPRNPVPKRRQRR